MPNDRSQFMLRMFDHERHLARSGPQLEARPINVNYVELETPPLEQFDTLFKEINIAVAGGNERANVYESVNYRSIAVYLGHKTLNETVKVVVINSYESDKLPKSITARWTKDETTDIYKPAEVDRRTALSTEKKAKLFSGPFQKIVLDLGRIREALAEVQENS